MDFTAKEATVILTAFEILESCGDDSWLNIKDDPALFRAFNDLSEKAKERLDKNEKHRRILRDKYGVTKADQVTPELVERILNRDSSEPGYGNRALGLFVALKNLLMTPKEAEAHRKEGPWMPIL